MEQSSIKLFIVKFTEPNSTQYFRFFKGILVPLVVILEMSFTREKAVRVAGFGGLAKVKTLSIMGIWYK
jgi:hypothetical protein